MSVARTQALAFPSLLWRWPVRLFEPSSKTLLSPAADVFMAGGASILLYIILMFFVSKESNTNLWGWGMYYAGFLVNFPHFAASYQLLYRDAGKDFFGFKKNPKFAAKLWWAGVLMPLILIGVMVAGMLQESADILGYTVNAMFFFVGWHYIKQIFGCVIVLSAAAKIYYSRVERWSLLAPLYGLWALSFVSFNTAGSRDVYYGMPYTTFSLPGIVVPASQWILGVSTVVMLGVLAYKFVRMRRFPPLSAVAALVSIYIWFIPTLNHPHFALIIPFFHSLQYILFVMAYKRNEMILNAPVKTKAAPRRRKAVVYITMIATAVFVLLPPLFIAGTMWAGYVDSLEHLMTVTYGMLTTVSSTLWLRTVCITLGFALLLGLLHVTGKDDPYWKFMRFITWMLLIGALQFSIVPTALDILSTNNLLPGALRYNTEIFGASLYVFLFTIFVNIHHYFIDNVLWKRDNPHVKENLFAQVL